MSSSSVVVRREPVILPTYEPLPPDKNPMFLEKRVYQGSSGRVYPLPFYNRIAETKRDRAWDAVWIENEFIKVMVLPEIGGRIHIGQDKTNGYDFFYRQNVIKPALVGLGGPWASGGVEFNWPQHHRPATFMPVDVEIESHPDGSRTIWLSDHDPMERMKGMHGVCLHPGRAVIELKMRAYNRTPYVQTFLWWANVATHVHEAYQSFFPPDVSWVADHAKRAVSRFPLCDDHYYGVNYGGRKRQGVPAGERPTQFVPAHLRPQAERGDLPRYAPNDLSWYANIPVPTSYMCLGSNKDFSGGYDFKKQAGLIQIANHHIAPGKKQWTWGNHDFGYAWDRNLTESDGPYIELMLGVYTDNQPDFSYLQPGETKAWSVYWYPIQKIGPAQAANVEAAVSLRVDQDVCSLGVAVTRASREVQISLSGKKRQPIGSWREVVAPDRPWCGTVNLPRGTIPSDLRVRVTDSSGAELISYSPEQARETKPPAPATEPPEPAAVKSADELYVIGVHLAQYRHATRSPVAYWGEALRRDPGDARCNQAMGVWHLRRGEFAEAERALRTAIERLTSRNPNPETGDAYYHLGVVLRHRHRDTEAYAAFYKSTWNQAWQAAGFHALAELDCRNGDFSVARDHVERALRMNQDNLRARNLRVLILRALGASAEADAALAATLALDPLDWWARHLRGDSLRCDTATRIDLALDYAAAGFVRDAIAILEEARSHPSAGTGPLLEYHLGALYHAAEDPTAGRAARKRAAKASPDYCFPARLEDQDVLEMALLDNPRDARAGYYLGNLFYDRRQYAEAIAWWERSARREPDFSIVWRNLGIAYFNVQGAASKALRAYERALKADPTDARVFYERDQLWKRIGRSPQRRLREFVRHAALVDQRDDATLEYCGLLTQCGRAEAARAILSKRKFQPWEGGEGQALGQYVRTHLQLGRAALARGEGARAGEEFTAALQPPPNLGEARHPLANASDIHYWRGEAFHAAGNADEAKACWEQAAASRGDFQQMAVQAYSEMTYYAALALLRLGRKRESRQLLRELLTYARRLARTPAKIDYFATSLPTMLLFADDLDARQRTRARLLEGLAHLGSGRAARAKACFREVLRRDPSQELATELAGRTP